MASSASPVKMITLHNIFLDSSNNIFLTILGLYKCSVVVILGKQIYFVWLKLQLLTVLTVDCVSANIHSDATKTRRYLKAILDYNSYISHILHTWVIKQKSPQKRGV